MSSQYRGDPERLGRNGEDLSGEPEKKDYVEIAKRLFELLDEYYEEYETETAPASAA